MTGLIGTCLTKRQEEIKHPEWFFLHGESESPLHRHESFMAHSFLMLAKKESKRGENRWKNSFLRLAPVAQYSQLRTAWSWPGVNVLIRQDEKVSRNVKAGQMIYILKQIGIVFFFRYRLSVPAVLLTQLPWCLPLSGSLLCTEAPAVTESYYTIKPSGNGMMCNDVVSYFFILHYMGSLNLLLLLTETGRWQGQSRCPLVQIWLCLKRANTSGHITQMSNAPGVKLIV